MQVKVSRLTVIICFDQTYFSLFAENWGLCKFDLHNFNLGRTNLGTILEMKCGTAEKDGAFIYKIGETEVLSESEHVFMEKLNAIKEDQSGF